MNSEQTAVKNWMMAFGQSCPPTPALPDWETRKLRAKLMLEETLETIEAMGLILGVQINFELGRHKLVIGDITFHNHDGCRYMTKIADGIADSLFVTYGTAVAFGIDIEPIFKAVCRSNDSKLWSCSWFDAEDREERWRDYTFSETYFTGIRKYVVTNEDGKIMKPPDWKSPDDVIDYELTCQQKVSSS